MPHTVPPNSIRIRVIRNLTSSSFFSMMAAFKNETTTSKHAYVISNKVSESFQKIRERLDSYRVFTQAVSEGELNPAALALLNSVLSQIRIIHNELGIEEIKNEISEKQEAISKITSIINEYSAKEISNNSSPAYKSSAKIWGMLKKEISPVAAIYVCLEVAIKYFSGLNLNINDGLANIIREISFPPEYQQAGISVLSYFSEIIKDRYPDMQVSVSIKQHGNSVTMIVTLPDGSKEEVNQILQQYGLVITGQISPREITSNDFRAFALQQKLEMAQLEIKQTKDLLQMQQQYAGKTIETLQSDVAMLKDLLGRELNSKNDLQVKLFDLTNKLSENHASHQVILLINALAESFNANDRDKARITLEDIKASEPDFFEKIHTFVFQATAGGIIGNNATEWLKAIFSSLPK